MLAHMWNVIRILRAMNEHSVCDIRWIRLLETERASDCKARYPAELGFIELGTFGLG